MTMLSDFERKVFRIFVNFERMKKDKPTVDDFTRLTSKGKMEIFNALKSLAKQGYIYWTNGDNPHN